MPEIGNGDSASAFYGGNRPSSQMTRRVLPLTDFKSSITGPGDRATPVLIITDPWRCATGPRAETKTHPFLRAWVPTMVTLHGPRSPDPSSSWHAAHESPPLKSSTGAASECYCCRLGVPKACKLMETKASLPRNISGCGCRRPCSRPARS